MKEITVRTQEEFDALPERFEETTHVYIKSNDLWVSINRTIINAFLVARGSSHVEAWGSSHVEARESSYVVAWESSRVVARGSSRVEAWGSSHVEARESSHVVARESSRVVARGSSRVEARGSSYVVAWGSSRVEAWGSSRVEAWGSSRVVAWGSSYVEARESSRVEAWGSSHVEARGDSHVEARMNSSVKIQSKTVVIEQISQQAIAICLEECIIKKQDKTAQVIVCPHVKYDITSFTGIYNANLINKTKIVLYKSVNPETFCDYYTGKIKYEGTVTCPDFDPDPERQCGGGLHLSPTPDLALSYHTGKMLKCKVALKDIVVHGEDITKVRCKKVKVLGEVEG